MRLEIMGPFNSVGQGHFIAGVGEAVAVERPDSRYVMLGQLLAC